MPPSVADWLPEGHLAWFVLDVVAELDLSAFFAEFRADGRGGAVYDPSMMLVVLVYGYCVGERSSRRIERRLVEDVAFRVVAANQCPNHATLARFRRRHEAAIGELFGQVLGLCAAEGLVDAGLVAIDGTKVAGNASAWSNRTRAQLAKEILAEAEATDAAEDAQLGERRGDELPEPWVDRRDRRARLRQALRQLDAQGPADYEALMAQRAAKEAELRIKLTGRKPKPGGPTGKTRQVNTTDPDSRMMKSATHFVQGYNAQAAVSADQLVLAAAVTNAANDSTQLQPMLAATEANLVAAGHDQPIGTVVADAGYWSTENATCRDDVQLLIVPNEPKQKALTPAQARRRARVLPRLNRGELTIRAAAEQMGVAYGTAYNLLASYRIGGVDPAAIRATMDRTLSKPANAARYNKRKTTVEPVFGQLKRNLGYTHFSRRGLTAVDSEWKLICAGHNLLKLWRSRTGPRD